MTHTITVIDDEITVTETTVHGDASHDATVASLSGGVVPTAELGAGVAGVTTFLRGDQSWAIPAGGGGGGAPIDATYVTTTANGTLTGEVLFSAVVGKGTAAARPAAGTAGRLYYVTDSGDQRWTRDTGSAWEDCPPDWTEILNKPTTFTPASHGDSSHDTTVASLSAGKVPVSELPTLDLISAPVASVGLNTQKITNLGTPTVSTDAVTKAYADAIVQGLDVKQSVRVATTVAGTLATSFENGDTIDGIVLATGDRILIKNQAAGAANGIYTVNASGAPTRATDADISAEVNAGMFTFVEVGTAHADQGWVLTTNNPITLDTTALSFSQFSGGSGGGAPTTATYITQTSETGLSNEQALNALADGLLKHTSGVVARAVPSTDYYVPGGTDVALADGGTGASLADPNADRIMFWDDSAGAVTWLSPGTNLTVTGTTIDAAGGGGGSSTHPYRLVNDVAATLASGDRAGVVAVKCTAANRIVTLPLADSHDGYRMTVILTGDSTAGRKIVLTPQGTDFLHYGTVGVAMDIDQPGAGLTVQAVASEDRWLVVSEVP